jgi:hypothetical protein
MVNKHFRGHYLASILAFFVVTLISILPTPTASAATSCAWTSQNSATCNGETFSGNSGNGSGKVTLSGKTVTGNGNDGGPSCSGTDTLVITNPKSATSGQLTTWSVSGGTGKFNAPSCSSSTNTASISGNWNNFTTNSGSTCNGIDTKGVNCGKIPLGCPGSSQQGPVSTQATLTCPYPPSANSTWKCPGKTCKIGNVTVKNGQTYSQAQCPSGATADSQGNCTCSDGSPPQNNACPTADAQNCGGGGFDWAVCPADTLFQTMANQLLQFMESLLNVNTDSIFGTSGNADAYYRAWNTFRILGTALIVIAGLIMVASQAFGLELLDAYTIRKTLPRLLIAIIGMSLSWPLLSFVIGFFNTLGADILNLMYAPFSTLPNHAQAADGIIGGWGVFAVVAGLMVAGYGGVLIPILGTGLLALLLAVVVLIVRQIGITLLVIVSPFAIAAYVLPNTKKIWDLWKDNFLGLMFMYPIVMMLFAAGEIFSAVAKSGGFAQQIVGIVAFYVPFFLVPMAFRMATGMISTISGMVHERGKGAFGRLAAARQNAFKKGTENLQNYNRFKDAPEKSVRGRLNKYMGRAANMNQAFEGGVGWNPSSWRKNMTDNMKSFESRHDMHRMAEFMEQNQAFGMFKGNEDYLDAIRASHGDEAKLRRILKNRFGKTNEYGEAVQGGYLTDNEIDQAVGQIRSARRSTSNEVFERSLAMGIAATGTGLKARDRAALNADGSVKHDANGNIEYERMAGGGGELKEMINETWGNDRMGAVSALVQARGLAGQARRFDINGGSTSADIGTMNAQYAFSQGATDGSAVIEYTDGKGQKQRVYATAENATKKTMRESMEGQGGGYMAAMRNNGLKMIVPEMAENVSGRLTLDMSSSPKGDENFDNLMRELAKNGGRYDAISGVAPENAEVFDKELLSKDATVSGDIVNRLLDAGVSNITDKNGMAIKGHIGGSVTMTNRQLMEYASYMPQYQNMRKEIGKSIAGSSQGIIQQNQYAQLLQQQGANAQAGAQGPPVPPVMPGPLPPIGSDARLKRDITPIATVNDIELYKFKYLWDDQEYVGVMAQDLIPAHQDALVVDESGYYMVDYTKLGIQMMTIEEWEEQQTRVYKEPQDTDR